MRNLSGFEPVAQSSRGVTVSAPRSSFVSVSNAVVRLSITSNGDWQPLANTGVSAAASRMMRARARGRGNRGELGIGLSFMDLESFLALIPCQIIRATRGVVASRRVRFP